MRWNQAPGDFSVANRPVWLPFEWGHLHGQNNMAAAAVQVRYREEVVVRAMAAPARGATRTPAAGTWNRPRQELSGTGLDRHVAIGLVTWNINDTMLDNVWRWLQVPLHRNAVDTVCTTSYKLNVSAEGSVVLQTWPTAAGAPGSYATQESIFRRVHSFGMRTVPVLWEDDSISCEVAGRCLLPRLRALAANATMRRALVEDIVSTCTTQGHAGLHVDFETHEVMTQADHAAMATFMGELAWALHAVGMTLSADVSPGKPTYELGPLVAAGPLRLMDFGTYAARPAPSRIPPLCVHLTRAGIEWCRCHRAVCMAQPCEEPPPLPHSGWACA